MPSSVGRNISLTVWILSGSGSIFKAIIRGSYMQTLHVCATSNYLAQAQDLHFALEQEAFQFPQYDPRQHLIVSSPSISNIKCGGNSVKLTYDWLNERFSGIHFRLD